jgi:hypothetical protein
LRRAFPFRSAGRRPGRAGRPFHPLERRPSGVFVIRMDNYGWTQIKKAEAFNIRVRLLTKTSAAAAPSPSPGWCEYDFHKHFHFIEWIDRDSALKALFYNGLVVV